MADIVDPKSGKHYKLTYNKLLITGYWVDAIDSLSHVAQTLDPGASCAETPSLDES